MAQEAARASLTDRIVLACAVVLALLSCLPVLAARIPQMGDYPAHMARFHVMLDPAHSPWLAQHYVFQWKWMGNLGADLLIGPLAALVGLEPAGRLIAGLIPVLTGLGIVAVEWALRRRVGIGTLLGFAFIWSPTTVMGFLNYGLAFAAALFAFALWVLLDGRRWRWALFLPVGVLVWLAHVSGWGVLGILVFGYEFSRRKHWSSFVAPWPLAVPLAPLLFGGGTKGAVSWGPFVWIYKKAILLRAMRDVNESLDLTSLGIVVAVLVLACLWRKIDGRMGWAALILLIGSFAMPRSIFGGDYADYRLIPAALLAGCLAIDWRAPRWVLLLAPLLFLVRLETTTQNWREHSAQAGEILTALGHVPQGARIASVVMIERGTWAFDPLEHISGWAVVRKDALVNSNFAVPGVHMMRLRENLPGFVDPSHRLFYTAGQRIDLSDYAPASHADWLWYVGDQPAARLPRGAKVIHATPGSLLARLAKRPPAR